MLERYLVSVLTSHFGHVIENLDTERIRVSAWNGEIVLKDVRLREDALEQLLAASAGDLGEKSDGSLDDDDNNDDDNGSVDSYDDNFHFGPMRNESKLDEEGEGDEDAYSAQDSFEESTGRGGDRNKNMCPVKILYGAIGTFELRIPWRSLRSQLLWGEGKGAAARGNEEGIGPNQEGTDPNEQQTQRTNASAPGAAVPSDGANDVAGCSIVLSDVNVLVTPHIPRDAAYSSERPRRRRRRHRSSHGRNGNGAAEGGLCEPTDAAKRRRDSMLLRRRQCKEKAVRDLIDSAIFRRNFRTSYAPGHQAEDGGSSRESGRWKWVQNIASNILSTLSVTVKNVHVRYEDPGNCLGFGLLPTMPTSWQSYDRRSERRKRLRAQTHQHPSEQYRRQFAVGVQLHLFTVRTTQRGPPKVDGDAKPPGPTSVRHVGEDAMNTDGMRASNAGETDAAHLPWQQDLYHGTETESPCRAPAAAGAPSATGLFTARHKLVAADNLSVYWDSGCELMSQERWTRGHVLNGHSLHRSFQVGSEGQCGTTENSPPNEDFVEDDGQPIGSNSVGISSQSKVDVNSPDGPVDTGCNTHIRGNNVDAEIFARRFADLNCLTPDESNNRRQYNHTYIVHPISPSLHFTLISSTIEEGVSDAVSCPSAEFDSADSQPASALPTEPAEDLHPLFLADKESTAIPLNESPSNVTIPPSRAILSIPASRIVVARDTLEDTAYLRKSLALWNGFRQNLVTEALLVYLTKIRPSVGPLQGPGRWWRYAFRAVRALSEAKRPGWRGNRTGFSRHRRNGWLGLARLLWLKKQYSDLNERLLLNSGGSSAEEREAICERLSSLEDELEPTEIAAFRLAIFKALAAKKARRKLIAESVQSLLSPLNEGTSHTHGSRSHTDAANEKTFQSDGVPKHTASTATRVNTTQGTGWLPYWRERSGGAGLDSSTESAASAYDVEDMPMLTPIYREHVFDEVSSVLESFIDMNVLFTEHTPDHSDSMESCAARTPTVDPRSRDWEVAVVCSALSLQADDTTEILGTRHLQDHERRNGCSDGSPEQESRLLYETRRQPIVCVSFVSVNQCNFYRDGSWDLNCVLASLEALDLTLDLTKVRSGESSEEAVDNPKLLSRKSAEVWGLGSADRAVVDNVVEEQAVRIGNVSHPHCASISIQKTSHTRHQRDEYLHGQTTTHIDIRLSPLEAVYSTSAIEALTRLFSAVQTPELANDYHRISNAVSKWRSRQQQRLMRVLSKREQLMTIDVDVAAPLLLIPEDLQSLFACPTLVLDLGRLTFHRHADGKLADYDDCWRLALTNGQVLCSRLSSGALFSVPSDRSFAVGHHAIVEPFDLEFVINTRVREEEDSCAPTESISMVHIGATLPRLVFSFNTSTTRLLGSLQMQWEEAKERTKLTIIQSASLSTATSPRPQQKRAVLGAMPPDVVRRSSNEAERHVSPSAETLSSAQSQIKFVFSAPLVALRLENDVDGRDCFYGSGDSTSITTTPLVNLSMQGIRGQMIQGKNGDGTSELTFSARLRALHAMDLYCQDKDFSRLVSSQRPELLELNRPKNERCVEMVGAERRNASSLLNIGEFHIPCDDCSDLVVIDFVNLSSQEKEGSKLSIGFHELYVEWNPETIAAVQKAVRLPPREGIDDVNGLVKPHTNEYCEHEGLASLSASDSCSDSDDSDLSFFDAISEEDENIERNNYEEDFYECDLRDELDISSEMRPALLKAISDSTTATPICHGDELSVKEGERDAPERRTKPFELKITLAKLRVRFNKESRRRRLLVAEMDRTLVEYISKPLGGSRTNAMIGNLSLIDPDSSVGGTLYGQILGLQTDYINAASLHSSSILTLAFETYPRPYDSAFTQTTANTREVEDAHSSTVESKDVGLDEGVRVDNESGQIHGSDCSLHVHITPMRFVYLQQLWMEIVDYFFEGILGYEVWGKPRPSAVNYSEASDARSNSSSVPEVGDSTSGSPSHVPQQDETSVDSVFCGDTSCINFLSFDIEMEKPMILLPVAYRSPQYIRFVLDGLKCANHFSGRVESETGGANQNGKANGTLASSKEEQGRRRHMQWYNSCQVTLDGLTIMSWCGRQLNLCGGSSLDSQRSRIALNINVRWPVGPTAPRVVPKWVVRGSVDAIRLSLRRKDYALFQNIIYHNIGEPSRHLDEWRAMQNLPLDELKRHKEQVFVHFGYDKKEGFTPTTYSISMEIATISVHFSLDDEDVPISPGKMKKDVADVICSSLTWSLRKLADVVFRQAVECKSINLKQTSGNRDWGGYEELLLPLHDDSATTQDEPRCQRRRSQLLYQSTSRPNGDTVKALEISDACIYMIYPAWMYIKQFFQNLPDPEFFSEVEIKGLMQVGDRWYRIGCASADSTIEAVDISGDDRSPAANDLSYSPSYQFRLTLISPRIVLVANSSSSSHVGVTARKGVTLLLSHLDYLYASEASVTNATKSTFFVDGLEIFTGSADNPFKSYSSETSLLHPLCVGGMIVNGTTDGDHNQHRFCCERKLFIETIRARAAYSDMTLAIEVILSVLSDYRGGQSIITNEECHDGDGTTSSSVAADEVSMPVRTAIKVRGFNLLVVDDSRRHFAGAQDLFEFSLGEIIFVHDVQEGAEEGNVNSIVGPSLQQELKDESRSGLKCETYLSINRMDLIDCLQPPSSPFRVAATSVFRNSSFSKKDRSPPGPGSPLRLPDQTKDDTMTWGTHAILHDTTWGYVASPSMAKQLAALFQRGSRENDLDHCNDLVEFRHKQSFCDDFDLKLGSFYVQWNPSTVIAMQRFMGRIKKEAKYKIATGGLSSQMHLTTSFSLDHGQPTSFDSDDLQSNGLNAGKTKAGERRSTRATVAVGSLTIFLNKEHQNRRLLEATLQHSKVAFARDSYGSMDIQGSVDDLSFWDPDEGSTCDENRSVLMVVKGVNGLSPDGGDTDSQRNTSFLAFRYKTFAGRKGTFADENPIVNPTPGWVKSLLTAETNIDDFLSISVATLKFTYLSDRTAELLDYLSNGLPGRGMGVTSRAAKGFISNRIKTHSFLDLRIDAPKIFLPQYNTSSDVGVTIRLGDVGVRSWFEGRTSKESEALGCEVETIRNPSALFDSSSEIKDERDSANASAFSNRKDWWRVLSLSLTGLGFQVRSPSLKDNAPLHDTVDLHISLRKPSWYSKTLIIRGRLSRAELRWRYREYALIRAVLAKNVSKEIDASAWDNVEKAYWMEEGNEETFTDASNAAGERGGVAYAPNARFVRYGQQHRELDGSSASATDKPQVVGDNTGDNGVDPTPSLDMKVELDGMCLTLHRDVHEPEIQYLEGYDVCSLRVQKAELNVSTNTAGDKSIAFSLYRLSLFDLGDHGRRKRHSILKSRLREAPFVRKPCAFSVLAEGYGPSDQLQDPSVVLTIDTCPSSSIGNVGTSSQALQNSKVTVARIVVNYLSVNMMLRPMNEITDFLTCAWNLSDVPEDEINNRDEATEGANESSPEAVNGRGKQSGFQVKFVAHYPKIFFLADESDPFSRALVLRGLAVINASVVKQIHPGVEKDVADVSTYTSLDANLNSMETYIHPNVHIALGQASPPLQYTDRHTSKMDGSGDSMLGIALIEPVTAAFEFGQVERMRFPTTRTFSLSMEPVSTMLSFEDLNLIETLLRRWSKDRSRVPVSQPKQQDSSLINASAMSNQGSTYGHEYYPSIVEATGGGANGVMESHSCPTFQHQGRTNEELKEDERIQSVEDVETFDVVFETPKLGLILRKAGGDMIVDKVASENTGVQVGDTLVSINHESVSVDRTPFQKIVSDLGNLPRPMNVTFRRCTAPVSLVPSPVQSSMADGAQSVKLPTPLPSNPFENGCDDSQNDETSQQKDTSTEEPQCSLVPFTVPFVVGSPNGLKLEKGPCGDVAIVSHVDRELFAASVKESVAQSSLGMSMRCPLPGAVILGVNNKSMVEVGYETTSEMLQRLDGSSDQTSDSNTSSNGSEQPQIGYTVTFLEADSCNWSSVDKIDVSVSGIKLTIIDDINGRDMPLLRGSLKGIDMFVERGLGLKARYIDVVPPMILVGTPLLPGKRSKEMSDSHRAKSMLAARSTDLTEALFKFDASGMVGIEYYNGRVALWEPLLESHRILVNLEWQRGNEAIMPPRPGYVGFVLGDGTLKEKNAETNKQIDVCDYVCVNITHASAEILTRALSDWKLWRKHVMGHPGAVMANTSMVQSTGARESDIFLQQGGSHTAKGPFPPGNAIEGRDASGKVPMPRPPTPKSDTDMQQAAQVALLTFAQKRGFATQRKADVAKPFVLRNRTGVRLAFVEQPPSSGREKQSLQSPSSSMRNHPTVGKYQGLKSYDSNSIREVADGDEKNFSMDVFMQSVPDVKSPPSVRRSMKVRTYDGQFPLLTVSLDSSVEGLTLDPICDLSVVKVGRSVRRVKVRRKGGKSRIVFSSLLVVWTVAVENNRRILTIQSSIGIAASGCGVPLEVGIRSRIGPLEGVAECHDARQEDDELESLSPNENLGEKVQSIGVAKPDSSPCFLPLWVFLHYRNVSVFVRPACHVDACQYDWSSASSLDLVPERETREIRSDQAEVEGTLSDEDNMIWKLGDADLQGSLCCCSAHDGNLPPVWLPYTVSHGESDDEIALISSKKSKGSKPLSSDRRRKRQFLDTVLLVSIGSSLSLRNMLPVAVEWEVATGPLTGLRDTEGVPLLDGSSVRKRHLKRYGISPWSMSSVDPSELQSGHGAELFSCDVARMMIHVRFKCKFPDGKGHWSEWAPVKLPVGKERAVAGGEANPKHHVKGAASTGETGSRPVKTTEPNKHEPPPVYQINLQSQDDECGTPLTVGMKLLPKSALDSMGGRSNVYGVNVVVFAELWLRNLTELPLIFGAPSSQVNPRRGLGKKNSSDSALNELDGQVTTAEAALLEISSVLEFGHRGRGLNDETDDSVSVGGDIYMLPQQQCDFVYDEVFEYIEVEGSTVVRRWWASEKHDSRRELPFEGVDSHGWMIDCAGGVKASKGGWESCRSIVGSSDNAFAGKRKFNFENPYRRRRWFRRRDRNAASACDGSVHSADARQTQTDTMVMFHQPVLDTASRAMKEAERNAIGIMNGKDHKAGKNPTKMVRLGVSPAYADDGSLRISIKCGDGRWSMPAIIPPSGSSHGVVRVAASRWPYLTRTSAAATFSGTRTAVDAGEMLQQETNASNSLQPRCGLGCLSPALYELSYHVSVMEGLWGEFSRLVVVSPRFLIRNDSTWLSMDVKQVGAPDATAVRIGTGDVAPFYWASGRLPELVCVRPVVNVSMTAESGSQDSRGERSNSSFRWSGGFDMSNLGMVALRIRQCRTFPLVRHGGDPLLQGVQERLFHLRTIRAHVEIRRGTGGTGIVVSFRDEDPLGKGSLFRVENKSPFQIWFAQDGILADISSFDQGLHLQPADKYPAGNDEDDQTANTEGAKDVTLTSLASGRILSDQSELHGDLCNPAEQLSFGLDVPFRQGKYAGRRAASTAELLRVRVGLAPLASREGLESTKVVGFAAVGEFVRLSPSKLYVTLGSFIATELLGVRVLGVVCADGPTRVLRFCLMEKDISPSGVIGNAMRQQRGEITLSSSFSPHPPQPRPDDDIREAALGAATQTVALMRTEGLPMEENARRNALLCRGAFARKEVRRKEVGNIVHPSLPDVDAADAPFDQVISFRASFGGFVFSIVDSAPSEIAVVSLRNVDIHSKFSLLRTMEASATISVGWLQVDNHCPSAPFPVALCPDERLHDPGDSTNTDCEDDAASAPFLTIGLMFAPKHTSGIMCLKRVRIAARDTSIAIDLAFIMRIQRFLIGLQELSEQSKLDSNPFGVSIQDESWSYSESRERWPLPDLVKAFKGHNEAGAASAGSQKLYFQGLTIFPCNVKLSVAPAKALTNLQATLEGNEAAAIHAAVRKGDLLIGDRFGGLGVKVGGKNRTALAVVRGVFKSILVDALLRCDGASLNFSGVALRYHISSPEQLMTYLAAHYLASLRNNVPALLGSLAAFGNPIGLLRGLGDGVSDFVSEPVKGLKRSVEQLDPTFVVDGVARGTGSLARHTVGGFADSAALLTETFSKNMAVLTLDRRYAQRRDRRMTSKTSEGGSATFVHGVESGVVKLIRGVVEGVTGVVRAPMRGAERSGVEGFAKGIGKGLLGLLVKPMIGLSDAATDVMIGVKGTMEGGGDGDSLRGVYRCQVRPRRALYGRDRALQEYRLADATAATIMTRTRLGGENYLSHCDMGDRVALLSIKRVLIVGEDGKELLLVKYKQIKDVEVRQVPAPDGKLVWGVLIFLSTPRLNGSEVEVVNCTEKAIALELCSEIRRGVQLLANDFDT